jgi:CHAT domain-containing protein
VSEQRPSLASDEGVVRAQQKLLDGVKLQGGTAEEREQALAAFKEAQRLSHDSGDVKGECDALLLESDLVYNLGNLSGASSTAGQAMQFAQQAGDRWLEAEGLANLARVKLEEQRFDESLNTGNRAIALYQTVRDRQGEHVVLENLAAVYGAFGEYGMATELLERVLAFARATGNQEGELYTLSSLAGANRELGNLQKALTYQKRALEIARAAGLTRVEGFFLADLGVIQEGLGQLDLAMESYRASLAFSQRVGSSWREARARYLIGVLYQRQGNHAAAREWVEASLPGLRAAKQTGQEASALADLARIDRSEGNLTAAEAHIEAALDLYEATRSRIPTEELRASFVAGQFKNYELAVEVQMELHGAQPDAGFDRVAFGTSERARAKSLLDLLGRGSQDLNADADPKLLERQEALEADLKKASEQQLLLLAREHTKDEVLRAEMEVGHLMQALTSARAETRASSPRLSSIAPSHTISVADVQRDLMDDDTALVEYFLGEARSFAWIVTRSSLRVIELAGRNRIESKARAAYKQLSTNSPARGVAVLSLSRLVLSPVEQSLPKRILIVPDGILDYIPFAALALSTGELLITRHTVVCLPSASTLEAIRRTSESRERASQLAAILADPVYSEDDPRVRRPPRLAGKTAPSRLEIVERSASEVGLLHFDRLYASRGEANIIRTLAANEPVLRALDFDASRETAIGTNVADARIVHFAAHGLLNPNHPELSGLVLSLVDEQGRGRNGFLSMRDVFDLRLRADLVVLSACETALGANMRGEGMVGLTRAFMYAGSPRVVASLWKVPDLATAELMKRFYQGLLGRKLAAAAALREAQLAIRNDPRWKAPYYWAGFTLQGEWK